MRRRKIRKFRVQAAKQVPKGTGAESVGQLTDKLARRKGYFEFFLLIAFLSFGVYQSVLYFGHKLIPNPDFVCFAQLGHELLSFKLPSSFMRAPVLGLLQAALSHLVGGQHPDLTAGWLLNAILHPFNLVLLYLVGKRIVGPAPIVRSTASITGISSPNKLDRSIGAGWIAIIAILNPWVIYMLTEPVVETTLLFFTLLTFYFLLKRSKWSYMFASIATMVRYEGAALIMAAFVMDMIHSTSRRQRIIALLYSALAALPLALWMLGTVLTWKAQTGHYFDVFTKQYAEAFTQPVEQRTGLVLHSKLLWEVGFRPLLLSTAAVKAMFMFSRLTAAELNSMRTLFGASQIITAASFAFGSIYGLCKRRWEILFLLLFFVPYFLLHARYPYPFQRFHINIFWIVLLICLFGLQSIWRLLDRNGRAPKGLVVVLQVLIAVISAVWLVSLVLYLPKIASISPRSVWLPFVAMILAGAIFAGRLYVHKLRNLLRELSILALVCLIIVSNQFSLVRVVGDGQTEKEFKDLADWYIANARAGEKMGVYMATVVKIFAPKFAQGIVALPKADSPEEFVKACFDQNITYVVWATREGAREDHTGYRQLGLHKNIAHLATPKSTGPYQFVTQVGSERGYVNIFRLRRPADAAEPASGSP